MSPAASYIDFVLVGRSSSGKTLVWEVHSKDGGLLGTVSWFGRWRCYAFSPNERTVFERRCLRDIAGFCESETANLRKKGR